ncbi:peptidase U32 family protein [Thermophagus sp. OGC60D27]|uniref:peptidase U32 family protein n=1 Tax=Thermophagus sp. OGC60D27 TaxID=3458415 RepID=UPI004037EA6B
MAEKRLKNSDFEVMAPVGSYESLMAAIQGGADSVYFGAEKLNMRSRSSANFTTDDLRQIVDIARKHHVKTYLTVNTVLYDDDLPVMRALIDAAKESGISAIIASDQAAIHYANSKGVEVHISTQVNISNVEALKFYSRFADVVVLARELNLNQVKGIHKAIEEEQIKGPSGELIRIEMFSHGALCMAISGKCYLSLHQMNSSANRGGCLQSCRRSYIVTEKETGKELEVDNEYIMSPKDLKTIHFLNKMIDAGVRVFKIEGRARGPEYVKTVVSCYREAINSVLDESYSQEKIAQWNQRLASVFNRGFWDGYYLGQKLGEWSANYGSLATRKKVYIGKGTNYFPKIGVAEFLLETKNLKVGDEILITGPTTGVVEMKVPELRLDLNPVEEVQKGDRFSMPVGVKIRRSDKLYKWVTVPKKELS